MGKPRSVRLRKTDTHNRGHSSQYESETEDSKVNTLYTTDDETCHAGIRKIKQSFTPNLDITSASECDETDDEVFSDACSDIDTNSIDTDVITKSKRSKSKIGEMAGIEDNKDKNIEMAETESLGDMEKPTAKDTLTEDKSEMTIQQLYQELLADRKYNAQRTAEFDRNIKQSEARIDKNMCWSHNDAS
ncbi:unnamed protein product [Mytilus coruscus]|uniref:Uncharacterized protein n=1 Tax=Mytilus coruscus TaxID=42192 RepID=A0A6J8C315_MYTCO|nr:unnamed protein product [Mytilus coruscus]